MTRPLVLFDLDGTLVDTVPDIARALGEALAEIGVAPPALDVVRGMVGDGARQLIRRARAGRPDNPPEEDALLARFLASYRAHVCVASRLYPGAREALVALRAGGAALAVVTNKPGDLARALLTTLDAAAELDGIIGDGDGFPRKPDPTAALRSPGPLRKRPREDRDRRRRPPRHAARPRARGDRRGRDLGLRPRRGSRGRVARPFGRQLESGGAVRPRRPYP